MTGTIMGLEWSEIHALASAASMAVFLSAMILALIVFA